MSEESSPPTRPKRGRPKGSTAKLFSYTWYVRQAVKEIRAIHDREGMSLADAMDLWSLGASMQGRKVHGSGFVAEGEPDFPPSKNAQSIILDQIRRELNRSRKRMPKQSRT